MHNIEKIQIMKTKEYETYLEGKSFPQIVLVLQGTEIRDDPSRPLPGEFEGPTWAPTPLYEKRQVSVQETGPKYYVRILDNHFVLECEGRAFGIEDIETSKQKIIGRLINEARDNVQRHIFEGKPLLEDLTTENHSVYLEKI